MHAEAEGRFSIFNGKGEGKSLWLLEDQLLGLILRSFEAAMREQEALGSLLVKHSCSAQHLPGREHIKAGGFANNPSATHEPLMHQNVCFGVILHL